LPPHLKKKKNNDCVAVDNHNVVITVDSVAESIGDLDSEASRDTHSDSSTNIIESKKADLRHRVNTVKSSGSAYFHKFLEIKCSYLCPNDLDDFF